MYLEDAHRKSLLKFSIYTVSAVFMIILFCTIRPNKVPFPKEPDVPAHIPFEKRPAWSPETNMTVVSKDGLVASDSKYCSEMGVEILRKGGNAADAAITTCLCIGSTDTMFSSGIGGGAFITSYLKQSASAISIDAREMAPENAFAEMFKGREAETKYGGLASGIPGELYGLWTLFQKHGSGNLEWNELVEPVAQLIDEGWEIDIRLAFALKMQLPAFKYFRKDWDFIFKDGTSQLLEEGDIIHRKSLAKTLRYVGKHGVPEFYNPKNYIARSLSSKIKEWGGIIKPEDFSKYKVNVEDAVKLENFTAQNLTVFGPSGASSGPAIISGLKIADRLNNFTEDYSVGDTHRMVEIMKWMASTRSYLGDIGIYNQNSSAISERDTRYNRFVDEKYIDDVISKIHDNETHPWEYYDPAYEPNDPHGTSSLSVIDSDGNAVTLTTTINLLFGSCIHDPETGVIMNNEMDDFSLPHLKNAFGLSPSIYNYIEPFKRPLSSSAQSIVINSKNEVELVIGAAGGSRITTSVFEAIIRTFYYNKDVTDVVANPRVHHQLLPDCIFFEAPVNSELVEALEKKGHKVFVTVPMTAMNAIRVKNGEMFGQSDWWRKFGMAAGI